MFQRYLCGCCVVLAAGLLRADEPQLRGFDDVRQLIESRNIDTLDKLVRALPDEFRSQYVLMTETQSSHQASKLRPRVIMMGNQCRLILAFSGSYTDPHYEALEMIEFVEDEAKFVFHQIKFDRRLRRHPVYSEANPSGCLDCHGASPRPNWEPAGGWKGALGDAKRPTDAELRQLAAYMYRKDARYRGLLAVENYQQVNAAKETFASKMAKDLNVLNAKRLARRLTETPDYETYKYALVCALRNDFGFLNKVPIDAQAGRTPEHYREMLTEVHCEIKKLEQQNISKFGWHGQNAPSLVGAQIVTNLRYLLETRGVDISDYSTSFASSYFLTSDSGSEALTVLKELRELDPDLQKSHHLLEELNREVFASKRARLPNFKLTDEMRSPLECPQDKAAREKQQQLARQQQQRREAALRNGPRTPVPATPAVPLRMDGTRINQPPKRLPSARASLNNLSVFLGQQMSGSGCGGYAPTVSSFGNATIAIGGRAE